MQSEEVIIYASAAYNTVFPAVSGILDIQGNAHAAQTFMENHMCYSAFPADHRHISFVMQDHMVPELLQTFICIKKG